MKTIIANFLSNYGAILFFISFIAVGMIIRTDRQEKFEERKAAALYKDSNGIKVEGQPDTAALYKLITETKLIPVK